MLTWAMLVKNLGLYTHGNSSTTCWATCHFTQQPFFAAGCHFVYFTWLQVDHVIYDPFLIGQNSATSLASRQQNWFLFISQHVGQHLDNMLPNVSALYTLTTFSPTSPRSTCCSKCCRKCWQCVHCFSLFFHVSTKAHWIRCSCHTFWPISRPNQEGGLPN